MEDEKEEIMEEYDMEENSSSMNIVKPLLALTAIIALSVGGFIIYKKRMNSRYIELPKQEKLEDEDRLEDED